ncbi:CPBP family intramembrane metalloprotease [Bacillus sp. ISL-47]|uniref:CPBP family intramembrane glutamic endopeptidase n=1 Tax=Bacillus sp. ISL-47 TaxID=2819130 RepID=UPI001BECCF2D|nr:CPBP family intramembrane glutamic endopeptidase [Bacillus sp. ISL-47]MBT2689615.1 CPBP family intramembrane metalloprotease [Bacillus sp. ISL-47]MBT2708434.1 CPBP family intramembrane metalloprotease [Pseudomonas sp. ISL-84]
MEDSHFKKKDFAYLQLSIFLAVLLLLQNKLFTFAFILSFALIIFLLVTSRQERVFSWTIAAYLTGNLLILYGDRLLDELPLQTYILLILNRVLLIIPILLLIYVSKKFNKSANRYWQKPAWNAQIYFPFIWRGFHSLTIKAFLIIALIMNSVILAPAIFLAEIPFGTDLFVFLIGFSTVNAFMEEFLWRGILLTRMAGLAGEKEAVIFSGISFGFSHLMLGYSFAVCLLFALGGVFYGAITVKSGSIIPAILWHSAINVLMILSGSIPFSG